MSSVSSESDEFLDAIESPITDNNNYDFINTEMYGLHRAVFENVPVKEMSRFLTKTKLDAEDRHGNTALHLAIMLGRKEHIDFLLEHNASIKKANHQGWTPLDEAISFGDRQIIKDVLNLGRKQAHESLISRLPDIVKTLGMIDDFQVDLRLEFSSWIPFLRPLFQSKICHIYKKGSCFRFDIGMLDENDRKLFKGNLSILFMGDSVTKSSSHERLLISMDNELKIYEYLRFNDPMDEEECIDSLMSSDILHAKIQTRFISFSRVQTGWLFSRNDKTEKVGHYQAETYSINGFKVNTKKRREHLTDEDIQTNRTIFQSRTLMNGQNDENRKRRQSLPPPPQSNVSWAEYIDAPEGSPPCLGRPLKIKESSKSLKASVSMSREFPLAINSLLNILEVVAHLKHFNKLKEFVSLKFPPGFPVKMEFPIFPTVVARFSFLNFQFTDQFPGNMFQIPDNYTENSNVNGNLFNF